MTSFVEELRQLHPALQVILAVAVFLFVLVHTLINLGRILKVGALEYYGRSISAFTALFLCSFYSTIAAIVLTLVGRSGLGQYTAARSFKYVGYLFTGVWFEIIDPKGLRDKTRPAVFVGNHQTELDVLFLGHLFPQYCSVTAKKSLQYVPFLGWFMSLSKTVFIERTSHEKALAAFSKAADMMVKERQSVYLFPEGTRSYYDHPDMLPFKKGGFHLAIQAQVPIVPVVCANYSEVLNTKKKIFRPGNIPYKILDPIETKGKTKDDVDAIIEQVRSLMLAELKKLTSEVGAQPKNADGTKRNGSTKAAKSE